MEMATFIGALMFAILGVFTKLGIVNFLIIRIISSKKHEIKEYDEETLCKFVGNLFFIHAGIFLLIAVSEGLNFPYHDYILVIGIILFYIATMAAVGYINTNNKFKR